MDGVNVSDSFIKVAPPAGEDSEVIAHGEPPR